MATKDIRELLSRMEKLEIRNAQLEKKIALLETTSHGQSQDLITVDQTNALIKHGKQIQDIVTIVNSEVLPTLDRHKNAINYLKSQDSSISEEMTDEFRKRTVGISSAGGRQKLISAGRGGKHDFGTSTFVFGDD